MFGPGSGGGWVVEGGKLCGGGEIAETVGEDFRKGAVARGGGTAAILGDSRGAGDGRGDAKVNLCSVNTKIVSFWFV